MQVSEAPYPAPPLTTFCTMLSFTSTRASDKMLLCGRTLKTFIHMEHITAYVTTYLLLTCHTSCLPYRPTPSRQHWWR
jgi:hypothetical protein